MTRANAGQAGQRRRRPEPGVGARCARGNKAALWQRPAAWGGARNPGSVPVAHAERLNGTGWDRLAASCEPDAGALMRAEQRRRPHQVGRAFGRWAFRRRARANARQARIARRDISPSIWRSAST